MPTTIIVAVRPTKAIPGTKKLGPVKYPDVEVFALHTGYRKVTNIRQVAFTVDRHAQHARLDVDLPTDFLGDSDPIIFTGLMREPEPVTDPAPAPIMLWFDFPDSLARVLNYEH